MTMTRTEAINRIESAIGAMSDEQLAELAGIAAKLAEPTAEFTFTGEQKAAIARSFEDFEHGRTLSLDEAEARTVAFLRASRAAP